MSDDPVTRILSAVERLRLEVLARLDRLESVPKGRGDPVAEITAHVRLCACRRRATSRHEGMPWRGAALSVPQHDLPHRTAGHALIWTDAGLSAYLPRTSTRGAMAFEHPTSTGVVCLTMRARNWELRFAGKRRGRWQSPDEAADAVAQHRTGLPEWDDSSEPVSRDIIDWRPIGESI